MKKAIEVIYLILCYNMGITTIVVKTISLHREKSKVGEVEKNLATYAFIEDEMASKSRKMVPRGP